MPNKLMKWDLQSNSGTPQNWLQLKKNKKVEDRSKGKALVA